MNSSKNYTLPLVSAVIITHNRLDLVVKAIASVQKQTYPDVELLVVDDASTDGTLEKMTAMAAEKRFRYIYVPPEESKGGNHARNIGILASKGLYVAFLDDDDEWLPEKTEKQVTFLMSHSEILAVHCGKIFEYNFKVKKTRPIEELPEGDYFERVWSKVPFTTSCLMVRRELFDRIGYFDEELRFWQEYELSIRITAVSQIGVVKENLVLYRIVEKDANRLTNKVLGWEDTVAYIEEKYRDRLSSLSKGQMKQHKLFIYKDGVLRSCNGKDLRSKRKYLKKIFLLQPNLKNFLRYALNRKTLRREIK